VYAGLPLALALWHGGAQVHLASLSFSQLELSDFGTPVEDITSLAAVAALDVRTAAVRSEAQRGRSGYVIKRGR
jgi:hypothetical protein